jgi:integrase
MDVGYESEAAFNRAFKREFGLLSVRAYAIDESFGLLVEVAASTGARVSQLARLRVCDLQDQLSGPRLMVPVSRKGRGEKKVTHRPVPIPRSLSLRLRRVADGRPSDALLLTQPNGKPWGKIDHARPFRRTVTAAGLDSATVTINALRHANITRQLLAGVPVRVVAQNHDSSIVMLERVYSHLLSDHSDAVARPAVLDLGQPTLLPRTAD